MSYSVGGIDGRLEDMARYVTRGQMEEIQRRVDQLVARGDARQFVNGSTITVHSTNNAVVEGMVNVQMVIDEANEMNPHMTELKCTVEPAEREPSLKEVWAD